MVLIADSGSTKSDWLLIDYDGNHIQKFRAVGLNPYHTSDKQLHEILQALPLKPEVIIDKLFFYGSGCTPEQSQRMVQQLQLHFQQSVVEVHSDILGAARALFKDEEGIAGILGTGSNTVLFNGLDIVKGVSAMGYQLGEDGSGAALGRELLRAYFHKEMSDSLREKMEHSFNMSPDFVKSELYKKPFPNRYLASFVPFIKDNIHDDFLKTICQNQFDNYFKYNYVNNSFPNKFIVGMVGSIAYHFADFLKVSGMNYGYDIGQVLQSPIDDLAKFHLNEL